jgi:hypothetical protein
MSSPKVDMDELAAILSGGNPKFASEDALKKSDETVASTLSSDGAEGFNLAGQLAETGYHPILIFGNAGSGKSILLTSLFSFANTNTASKIGYVTLGEPIIPLSNTYGAEIWKEAENFFNRTTTLFTAGKPAEATKLKQPIFIPISLRSVGSELRFAFMESSGENYHIDESTSTYFPKLKEETSQLYRQYAGPISILIIAPFEGVNAEDEDYLHKSDLALLGQLHLYQTHRSTEFKKMDRFLFVLTKWDLFTKIVMSKDFYAPAPGVIENAISERYKQSWPFFNKMDSTKRKNTMAYSAAIMDASNVLHPLHEYRAVIGSFPQKLWDWLIVAARNEDLNESKWTKSFMRRVIEFFKKIFF